MERKERERHILTLVYDESEYAEVADSEKPDFLIRHHGEARPFGVEITEFYFYDTDARLRNIHDYVTDIIDHGRFRHKDDTKLLEVLSADIVSAEGKDKGRVRFVLHKSPPVEEYIQAIGKTIEAKETRYQEYKSDVSHINLIVYDFEHRLWETSITKFCRAFFTPDIIPISQAHTALIARIIPISQAHTALIARII